MTTAAPARPAVLTFGDLPRREQLLHYLRWDQERLERCRAGYVRDMSRGHSREMRWKHDPEKAARRVYHYEARVQRHRDELADDLLARLTPSTADPLEDARWEALTAERDALAAQLSAVEQLAERWGLQRDRYREQGAYSAAGFLVRITTQLREAIA
ncbi:MULTISPECIES: hypothetical protein [unclassified Microbacterium]|uniref:hypothetical protein n=1 Tax=unclassified Microbacterium TaxID=2609290 RepID=UPI003016F605